MKKLLTSLCVIAVSVFTGCVKKANITLLEPENGASIIQTPAEMRTFLLLPDAERKNYFNDKAKRAVLYKQHQSLANTFKWQSDVELDFNIDFALDEAFTQPAQEMIVSLDSKEKSASVCNFMAGKKIYWRITGTDANGNKNFSPVGFFTTENVLPRQLTIPGIDNIRDIGGWKTADGKRMRQGILFRSAGFNLDSPDWQWDEKKRIDPKKSRIGDTLIKQEGIDYLVKKVGVKTDLDLRWDGEVAVMNSSPLGEPVKWIHVSSMDYGSLFTPEGIEAARINFKLCADKNNYPMVFHCIAGADRTGTLAFILCGLLGVSSDDLRKDWEVTARDYFNYQKYDKIAPGFDKYGEPGDTLAVKIEKFLLAIGVTQQEIDAFKKIAVEQ